MRRRQLLAAGFLGAVSGCTTEVTIRQPTPTVRRFDRYRSDENIKISVSTAGFKRSNCRFRVAGTFSDIQWPKNDISIVLLLYDDSGTTITSRERLFESIHPGDVIEFEMEVWIADCERPAGYDLIGRRHR